MKLSTTSALVIILLCLVFILIFKYHWSRRKLYTFASQLQGPIAYPFVGSGLNFLCKQEEILNVFLGLTTPYPSPTRLWIGPRLVIIVKDPAQIQTILQSSKLTQKAYFYRILEPFLGQGLVTSSGPIYRRHKKVFQPLFGQRMVEGYSHLFQKHANKFVDTISKHVNRGEFDITEYLHVATFEGIMDVLLEDSNCHSLDYEIVPQYVKRFYKLAFKRLKTFWLHSDFIFEKTSYYKELMMLKKITNTMIKEVMNTTVFNVIKRIKNESQSEELRTPSVLEMLVLKVMKNPKSLTIEQCVDHILTLIGASNDTTNTAITFTCMMLGAYPEKQKMVVQEMKEVLGDRTTLDMIDVSKLKYLEMCIKESMRLFPVIPFIFRDTVEEFQLGKYTIPEDVTVTISIYHAHKHPKVWERPNEFYPEHFLPEATVKRHPYAFIPFSAGPRKCLGLTYGYTNIAIFIGTLLLHYEIECSYKVEDIKLTADIGIRPLNGHFIKIKKRL